MTKQQEIERKALLQPWPTANIAVDEARAPTEHQSSANQREWVRRRQPMRALTEMTARMKTVVVVASIGPTRDSLRSMPSGGGGRAVMVKRMVKGRLSQEPAPRNFFFFFDRSRAWTMIPRPREPVKSVASCGEERYN